MPARLLTAMVVAALAAGCVREAADAGGPESGAEDGSARLRTGHAAYVFTPDGAWERAAVDFVYENHGADTLYQPACRPNGGDPGLSMAVQERVEDGWETVWEDSTLQPRLNTEVEIEGTYRLFWQQLLRTYDPNRYPFGEELPESLRVSNTFRLSR